MRPKLVLYIFFVLIIIGFVWLHVDHASMPTKPKTTAAKTMPQQTDSFNKDQYSLTDPTSIWVIVNKQHPLQPADYVPPDLTVPNVPLADPGAANMQMRAVTATALEQMFAGAKQQGINLRVVSAYRSYSYQQSLYNGYVASSGQAVADAESARAGYSEHQTGLSVDIGATDGICDLSQCFGSTPEGEWLAANSYEYGFILRYTADKEAITGYEYEPWHFRYVGTSLSEEMHKTGIQTLEEFFGVSGGTIYKAEP
jgi:D-alanyl-D-alanine carboxypeptidase